MSKTTTKTITNPVEEKHPVAKIIGERIRLLRMSQGITQRELAEKMDVCLQTVWFWEAGKRSPPVKRICLLAKILNISTDYLLGLSAQKETQQVDLGLVFSRLLDEKRIAENHVYILIGEKRELKEKVEQFKTMTGTNAVMVQATLNKYGCRLPDEDVKEIEEFLKQLVHFKL